MPTEQYPLRVRLFVLSALQEKKMAKFQTLRLFIRLSNVVTLCVIAFMLVGCDITVNNSPQVCAGGNVNCTKNNGGSTPAQPPAPPPPSGGSTSPIAEGDFLYSPGPVTGPAIVEFWNGLDGASKVCGTFQLPTGESFNYKAGHWWKYKSVQDMQTEWPLHLALYNQKPENIGCTNGQRPPS